MMPSFRPLALVLAVCLATVALAPRIRAQDSSTAAIRGTVTDPTGARIAGAAVSAERENAGGGRSTTTNSAGDFVLQFLPPGTYNVRVNAPQMSPEIRSGIRAEVG